MNRLNVYQDAEYVISGSESVNLADAFGFCSKILGGGKDL